MEGEGGVCTNWGKSAKLFLRLGCVWQCLFCKISPIYHTHHSSYTSIRHLIKDAPYKQSISIHSIFVVAKTMDMIARKIKKEG